MASADEMLEHLALPTTHEASHPGLVTISEKTKKKRGMSFSMREVIEGTRAPAGPGLDCLHGLEEGCTATQLLLDACLGQAPRRTYSLSESPGQDNDRRDEGPSR